jgi:CubicO group peptidase (beta-lactamase class C family)
MTLRDQVRSFLQKEIDLNHIPGAVISVGYRGETVLEEAIGNRVVHPDKAPMQLDTVFDLASLTKVVATLPMMLKLIDDGAIRLDDPVAHFLPKFAQNGKESVRLFDVLTHSSGLPAHVQYYAENLTTDNILERIYQQGLEYPIGKKVIYSDLGLITLYKVIEVVTGQAFPALLHKELFAPLEMKETGFNPSFSEDRYAATEYNDKLGGYKLGIVHDDNTEAMGGISGHAGLFSTVHDLQNFTEMIENKGVYKGKRILSERGLVISRRNYTPFAGEYRGLGWILKGLSHASCGDLFSNHAYGHTGFTGTSIWFDPDIRLHVILLTNRVHFGREPNAIIRLRPRLHNLIRAHVK